MARWRVLGAVLLAVVVAAACSSGGGGGEGLGSNRPSTSVTTPTTDGGGPTTERPTTTDRPSPTTTERTTTTEASTPTTERTTTTEASTETETTEEPTEEALPPPAEEPATTPASTTQEGDTGWWWLLLLASLVVGLIVWLVTRPKGKPIDERWRTQVAQLAADMESVSHLLLAGADPDGAIANDRWSGVLSRSQELRRLATNLAAAAQTVELRDAVSAPVDALRSLELSADAARLHVVGATNAAQGDNDRVSVALVTLRELVSPTAAAHH